MMMRRPAPEPDELSIVDLLRIVNYYRLLVGGVVLLGIAIAVASLLVITPTYTATALVIIDPQGEPDAAGLVPRAEPVSDGSMVDSQVRLLTSRSLAAAVVEELGLGNDPELESAGEGGSRRTVIDGFLDRLEVKRQGRSQVIEIAFRSEDPETAAQGANALARVYIKQKLGRKYDATERATRRLADQLELAEKGLRTAESSLNAYRSSVTPELANAPTLGAVERGALEREATAASAERAARASQLVRLRKAVSSGGELPYEVFGGSPVLQELYTRHHDAVRREAELATRYGARHPMMRDVEAERRQLELRIRDEQAALVERVAGELEQAQAREQTLKNALAELKSGTQTRRSVEARLAQLEREVEHERRNFESVSERVQAVSDWQTVQTADARIISHAEPPASPSAPKPRIVLSIVTIAALATALFMVFLLEQIDHGFRSARSIQLRLSLPCLGTIPLVQRSQTAGSAPHDYLVERPRSRYGEAVRALLASASLIERTGRARVVLIASSTSGEGKTTMVLSLARSAAGEGLKVLMIDADLRRPQLARMLGAASPHGLIEVLEEKVTLERCLCRDGRAAVDLIPGSDHGEQAARHWTSAGLGALLARQRAHYDLILVDTAPLVAITDTRLMAPLVDRIIFVARWQKTPIAVVEQCLGMLEPQHDRIAGVVLNQIDLAQQSRLGRPESAILDRRLSAYYTD